MELGLKHARHHDHHEANPTNAEDRVPAHAAIVDLLDLCLQLPLSLAEQIDAVLELGNLVRQAGNVLAGRSVGIADRFGGCGGGRGIACAWWQGHEHQK